MKQFARPKKYQSKRNGQSKKARRSKTKSRPIQTSMGHDHILHLQQTIGNQAVQRMIKSGVLQLKTNLIQPGDVHRLEVERLIKRVDNNLASNRTLNSENLMQQNVYTSMHHPSFSPRSLPPTRSLYKGPIQREITLEKENLKYTPEKAVIRYRNSDAGKKIKSDEDFLALIQTFDNQTFKSERAFKSALYKAAKRILEQGMEGYKERGDLIRHWQYILEDLPSKIYSPADANQLYFKFGMYEKYSKTKAVDLNYLVRLIIDALRIETIELSGLKKALETLTSSWPLIPGDVREKEDLLKGVETTFLGLIPQLENALQSVGNVAMGERVFLESTYRDLLGDAEKDADISYIDKKGVLHLIEAGYDFGVLYNKLTGKKKQFNTYLQLRNAIKIQHEAAGPLTSTELSRKGIEYVELSYTLPEKKFKIGIESEDTEQLEKVFIVLVTLSKNSVTLRAGDLVYSGQELVDLKDAVAKRLGK